MTLGLGHLDSGVPISVGSVNKPQSKDSTWPNKQTSITSVNPSITDSGSEVSDWTPVVTVAKRTSIPNHM